MRPKWSRIAKSGQDLQKGHYMVDIDENGRASVMPITSEEQQMFITEILGAEQGA